MATLTDIEIQFVKNQKLIVDKQKEIEAIKQQREIDVSAKEIELIQIKALADTAIQDKETEIITLQTEVIK